MGRLTGTFLAVFCCLILGSSSCKTLTPSQVAAEDIGECNICMNNFDAESKKASTPCGQEICTLCLEKLIATSLTSKSAQFPCPFCRQPIGIKRKDKPAKGWFFDTQTIIWPGEVRVQYAGEVLSKSDHRGFYDLKVDFANVPRGVDPSKGGSFTVRVQNQQFQDYMKHVDREGRISFMSFYSEAAGDVTNRIILELVSFDRWSARYTADGTMMIAGTFRYFGNEFM